MHVGDTDGPGAAVPMLDLSGQADGAVSPDGQVMGVTSMACSHPMPFARHSCSACDPARAWR